MGRDDAVGRGEQRVVRPDRLGGYHIQPSGVHLTAAERSGQVLLHDQRPPGVVQNDDAILHLGDGILINNACCLRK